MLWQTDTITIAHEHFISTHLKQKILLNIEKLQNLEPRPNSKTFVLFLPENEVHDIGLLFINYELRSRGYHTIFLGESVPKESLTDMSKFFEEITFISYFTIKPSTDNEIYDYFIDFKNLLLDEKTDLMVLGKRLEGVDLSGIPEGVKVYKSISELVKIM
jgi:hypothetical protein